MKFISKQLLLGIVVAFAVVTQAAASWTGYYAGANVGGGMGQAKAKTTTIFSPTGYFATTSPGAIAVAGAQTVDVDGGALGVQGGYNWQVGRNIVGIEADFGYFGMSGSESKSGIYPCCAPTGFTVKSKVSTDWLLTVRPRFAWATDKQLYYVTGGLAVTKLTGKFTFSDTFATAAETGSVSKVATGWTLGGGAEFALSGPWSMKAEYLYADFGKVSGTSNNLTAFTPPIAFPTSTFTHSVDLKVNIVRVGVNYKF